MVLERVLPGVHSGDCGVMEDTVQRGLGNVALTVPVVTLAGSPV